MNFDRENNSMINIDKTLPLSPIFDENSLLVFSQNEPHSEFCSPSLFQNEEPLESSDNCPQSDYQNTVLNILDSPKYDEEKNDDKNSHYYLVTTAQNLKNNQEKKTITNYREKENTIPKTSNLFTSEKKREMNYRNDFYKKHFKVQFIKFLKSYGNSLIVKSPFPKKLKRKLVLSLPNSIKFTSNSKESENYSFLFLKLEDILTLGKGTSSGSLQNKNFEVIKKIKEHLDNLDEQEETKFYEIKNFLFNMTLEDAYELFYASKDFEDFKKDEKTAFYDKEFIKEKHFSLLEKNGFIKLTKMYFQKDKNI